MNHWCHIKGFVEVMIVFKLVLRWLCEKCESQLVISVAARKLSSKFHAKVSRKLPKICRNFRRNFRQNFGKISWAKNFKKNTTLHIRRDNTTFTDSWFFEHRLFLAIKSNIGLSKLLQFESNLLQFEVFDICILTICFRNWYIFVEFLQFCNEQNTIVYIVYL